jgi:hypothetical protein
MGTVTPVAIPVMTSNAVAPSMSRASEHGLSPPAEPRGLVAAADHVSLVVVRSEISCSGKDLLGGAGSVDHPARNGVVIGGIGGCVGGENRCRQAEYSNRGAAAPDESRTVPTNDGHRVTPLHFQIPKSVAYEPDGSASSAATRTSDRAARRRTVS